MTTVLIGRSAPSWTRAGAAHVTGYIRSGMPGPASVRRRIARVPYLAHRTVIAAQGEHEPGVGRPRPLFLAGVTFRTRQLAEDRPSARSHQPVVLAYVGSRSRTDSRLINRGTPCGTFCT